MRELLVNLQQVYTFMNLYKHPLAEIAKHDHDIYTKFLDILLVFIASSVEKWFD